MWRANDRAEEEARKLGKPFTPQWPWSQAQTDASLSVVVKSGAETSPQPETGKDEETLLTSAEAAKLLGYSEKSFRNAVSLRKIPHYKLFGQNRFKKSELMALLVRVESR